MSYPTLPDRRMPYHRDGTVMMQGTNNPVYGSSLSYPSGADLLALNGFSGIKTGRGAAADTDHQLTTWLFFPEQREVTAIYYAIANVAIGTVVLKGSNDTTNGLDGTWETASWTPVAPEPATETDQWRSGIKTVSFTGPKRAIRLDIPGAGGSTGSPQLSLIHVYGEKSAGQTPDDLIFIDHDTTPGVEYTAPEDFGDRPLGTTVVRQFRVKNASATLTANSINLQCNDSDFAISTDGTTWVVTINVASLAPGVESATLYVRCTTPAPGATLGPRFAEIVAIVGSWS